jgi:hypothetical protein
VTANDDAGLVVEDNNATYISMLTPDVSESGILFGSPVNGANGGIIFNNAALPDGLQFRINGNQTRMVIESTGEVGIGTTAPAASLHVAGDVRTDGATGYNTRNSNNLGANAIFGWSNDVPRIRIGGDGVGAANGLDIQTTSDRSLLRLLHSGDVGISTTTPETELDVRSLNADDPGRVRAANSSADTWVELWSGFSNGSNDPAVIWSDDLAGDDLRFGIGDQDGAPFTELMRITGAGNVGIGTTAPARRLHVSAGSSGATSTSSAEAVIEDDASTFMHFLTPNNTESGILFGDPTHSIGGGIVFNSAANPEGMQFRAGGNNTQMVLDASGNLGIGTTSPAQKLDVSGNIQLTGEVRRVATGTANMVPVAYGRVRENGTIASGSGNFTATWNSGAEHYEITVTGEAIDSSSCTVLVTLLAGSSDGVRTAYTSSVGGRLVVEIHDVFGPILHDFSFVVFKP